MKLRIMELCKAAGITQAELAERVGISRVGLSKAVNGNPTLDTLEKIANALQIPITDLFAIERPVQSGFVCPSCGAKLKIVLDEREEE